MLGRVSALTGWFENNSSSVIAVVTTASSLVVVTGINSSSALLFLRSCCNRNSSLCPTTPEFLPPTGIATRERTKSGPTAKPDRADSSSRADHPPRKRGPMPSGAVRTLTEVLKESHRSNHTQRQANPLYCIAAPGQSDRAEAISHILQQSSTCR